MGPSLGAHDAMMPWYLPGLVNIHTLRTGKKHLIYFQWVNHYKWQFSIAMLLYQRVILIYQPQIDSEQFMKSAKYGDVIVYNIFVKSPLGALYMDT